MAILKGSPKNQYFDFFFISKLKSKDPNNEIGTRIKRNNLKKIAPMTTENSVKKTPIKQAKKINMVEKKFTEVHNNAILSLFFLIETNFLYEIIASTPNNNSNKIRMMLIRGCGSGMRMETVSKRFIDYDK